jgi:hypothetical protein
LKQIKKYHIPMVSNMISHAWTLRLLIFYNFCSFINAFSCLNLKEDQARPYSRIFLNFEIANQVQTTRATNQITHTWSKDIRNPLDVMLVRLHRLKDSKFFGVLVFGVGFGSRNVHLVIIQLLCPTQPIVRLLYGLSTYFTPVFNNKIFSSA